MDIGQKIFAFSPCHCYVFNCPIEEEWNSLASKHHQDPSSDPKDSSSNLICVLLHFIKKVNLVT